MKNQFPTSKLVHQCFFLLIFISFSIITTYGQKGIQLNTPEAFDGYKLCTSDQNRTYLLNNCGRIVNTWLDTRPQYYCRLTDEGNLIYIYNNQIIERDWNNNTVNTVTLNSTGLILDYEVMKLANGNFLAASRRLRSSDYFDELGWDPDKTTPNRTDGVVEIDPNGNIVWEWNIGDHTIQDKITDASNYGSVQDHPELVDVNAISSYDWQFPESFMINSIDYNPELDQILISVRKVSEFMIIDHSTTTEEAAGSTGGNSEMGGDILYRWGNPQNYGQGSEEDRVLYFQHNPNWVKYGEHKGKIIVYNNGLSHFIPNVGSISSVHIVNPPVDNNGNYMLNEGEAFAPSSADVTINKVETNTLFYSGYTSGAQVLPNGNIYITVGLFADFLEVKTDGTKVWEYSLPNTAYIFRSEQYPRDFPGFEGKDLSPDGTVEIPSSSYNCELFTSTKDISNSDFFEITYNQISNLITITELHPVDNVLEIRNDQGQLMISKNNVSLGQQFSLNESPTGVYFITLYERKTLNRISHKIVKL